MKVIIKTLKKEEFEVEVEPTETVRWRVIALALGVLLMAVGFRSANSRRRLRRKKVLTFGPRA